MKPSLRFPISVGTVAGALFLSFAPIVMAQDSSSAATSQKQRQTNVITNENVKLPLRPAALPTPQPATLVVKAPVPSPEDAAAKTSEIVALQKQIKDKQKRIELLMHLFVTDEQRFLQSPADADPAAQTRIRAEQEELRGESAACARLQARLDALNTTTVRP